MYFRTLVLLTLSSLFLLLACNKDRLDDDKQTIRDYITEKGLTAEETPEGVFFISTTEGTGAHPVDTNTVTVHYEGFLLDGYKFDSSIDRGMTSKFRLNQVIEGWTIGIPLLKKGGSGTLIIPSTLGYGGNPPLGSGIPANAILLFDVQLIDFE